MGDNLAIRVAAVERDIVRFEYAFLFYNGKYITCLTLLKTIIDCLFKLDNNNKRHYATMHITVYRSRSPVY